MIASKKTEEKILYTFDKFKDTLINKLEQKQNPFKNYIEFKRGYNYSTKTLYTGINIFILYLYSIQNNNIENRFLTFKQGKELNLSVKRNSKAVPILYYNTYLYYEGRKIDRSDSDFDEILASENARLRTITRHYNVFPLNMFIENKDVDTIKENSTIEELSKLEKTDDVLDKTPILKKISANNLSFYNNILLKLFNKQVVKAGQTLSFSTPYDNQNDSFKTFFINETDGSKEINEYIHQKLIELLSVEVDVSLAEKELIVYLTLLSLKKEEQVIDSQDYITQNLDLLKSWENLLKTPNFSLYELFQKQNKFYIQLLKKILVSNYA